MDTRPNEISPKRRSGSAARRRQIVITFRASQAERSELESQACGKGLTLGSHIRGRLFESPQTRQRRRPLADVAALARLMGELNRIGSNINQVARAINLGETPLAHEIQEAMSGLREVIAAIRAAMGLGGK
jgi:hypothetical protein